MTPKKALLMKQCVRLTSYKVMLSSSVWSFLSPASTDASTCLVSSETPFIFTIWKLGKHVKLLSNKCNKSQFSKDKILFNTRSLKGLWFLYIDLDLGRKFISLVPAVSLSGGAKIQNCQFEQDVPEKFSPASGCTSTTPLMREQVRRQNVDK